MSPTPLFSGAGQSLPMINAHKRWLFLASPSLRCSDQAASAMSARAVNMLFCEASSSPMLLDQLSPWNAAYGNAVSSGPVYCSSRSTNSRLGIRSNSRYARAQTKSRESQAESVLAGAERRMPACLHVVSSSSPSTMPTCTSALSPAGTRHVVARIGCMIEPFLW